MFRAMEKKKKECTRVIQIMRICFIIAQDSRFRMSVITPDSALLRPPDKSIFSAVFTAPSESGQFQLSAKAQLDLPQGANAQAANQLPARCHTAADALQLFHLSNVGQPSRLGGGKSLQILTPMKNVCLV